MARSSAPVPAPLAARPRGWWPAVVLGLLPAAAPALTWDVVPYGSAGGGYETNPGSASDSDLEDDGYVTLGTARADIIGESRTSRVALQPEIQGAIYSGTTNEYRDDNYGNYFLPVTMTEGWQTAQASFSGGYSRVSTRDSVVIGFDPNNPQRPGIDTTNRRTEYQQRWYVAPSFRYQLTPRDILGVSFNYDDVSFTEAEFSGRADYTASAAEISWDRSLTQQSTVTLSANASGFQATRPTSLIENDTLTYGLTAGYQFALTPSSTVGFTAGASRSEVKVKGLQLVSTDFGPLPCLDPAQNEFVLCTLKGTDDNFIGQVFYRQRTDKTITTELRLSRSIEPNSDGSQVTLDQAGAFATKEFTSMLTAQVGALYTKQDAVASQGGALSNRFSREYYSLEASMTRRLSRTWSVRGQYSFTEDQQTAGLTYSVPNHRLYIYVQYSGLGSH